MPHYMQPVNYETHCCIIYVIYNIMVTQ